MDKHRGKRQLLLLQSCLRGQSPPNDSGSESAPLLSSGGSQASSLHRHSSPSSPPPLHHRSQTSDLDCSSSTRLSAQPSCNYEAVSSSPIDPRREPALLRTNKAHLLDAIFFDVDDVDDDDDDDDDNGGSLPTLQPSISSEEARPKQSSLITIFSVSNTILGSSMLTMPWGIYMAGFVPAIMLILAMSGLCLFTAYKLLQVHKYHGGGERIEVMELSRYFLGSWAEHMAKIFSISVLLGANIAYWILMSNFLYNSVNFFYDVVAHIPVIPVSYNKSDGELLCPKEERGANGTMGFDNSYDSLGPAWDLYRTVPIFLAFLVFPILNFNTTTFFTKFNSLGTVSIVYLVIFVLVKSRSWGINMDRAAWQDSWILRPTFPALTGMLSLSFFIHNIIITIMQSNRNQRKNGRDLTIAYVLVTITYIIVGIVFYVCFPLAKSCIEDNLLNNFQKDDGLTVGARVVLLFQLFTVYPLIAFMLRKQLLASFVKSRECRQSTVLIVNLAIVTICVLFALFLPHVGTIVRYTGAFSGLVYVFMLPSLLHLMVSRRQGRVTACQLLCHTCVPVVGLINLLSQFFVQAN